MCDVAMEYVVLLFSEALRTATVAQSSESKKRPFYWSRGWLKGGCFTGKPWDQWLDGPRIRKERETYVMPRALNISETSGRE